MSTSARVLDAGVTALVARRMDGRGDSRGAIAATLLILRQITQIAVLRRHPSIRARRMGVAVDAAHGASMVGLAVLDPSRRRLGLAAAASAGLQAELGRRGLRSPTRAARSGGARPR